METISLAINSHKPVMDWIERALKTAVGFDEISLYVQAVEEKDLTKIKFSDIPRLSVYHDGKYRSIKDGFNFAIAQTKSDWVCSFCDDDWFIEGNLKRLLDDVRGGMYAEADVIPFKVQTENGFTWGAESLTIEGLRETNQIPHSSFIRKSFFDKIGGYKTDCGSDWNLWLRAMENNARFKFFNEPVYYFRQTSHRSAYQAQLNQHGGMGGMRHIVNTVK